MTFAQEFRQIWIDAQLARGGLVRRCMVCEAFGITIAAASADFRTYLANHPEMIAYDKSAKGYRRVGSRNAFPRRAHVAVLLAQQVVAVKIEET